ncbi:MAG: MYXO-CTERM sorting domain-containing protein [Polyangiaceae bacterium]
MRRSIALFALLACSVPGLDAAAATWHKPTTNPGVVATHGTNLSKLASRYLESARKELRLGQAKLVLQRELSLHGSNTVRFGQTHRGLPVLGAGVVVRLDDSGKISRSVVDVADSLSVDITPKLSQGEALERAARFGVNRSLAAPRFLLAVLPSGDGAGYLVWQVDVPSATGGFRYLIDAHDGALRGGGPLGRSVMGRVYEKDPVTTPTLVDTELLELVAGTPQHLTGWNGNLTVTNYVSGDPNQGQVAVEQILEPNSGEDFLYDPPADPTDAKDAFAQVNLYYHLTRMKSFYETDLNIDMSASSWKLVAVANLEENGSPLDNAFFSPQGINSSGFNAPNMIGIGQGSSVDFALDSDVFLHEFTHYVSGNAIGYNGGQTQTSEYGLSPWGGAIDEGISDYFACTENESAVLGETSLGALGAERNLEDTSKSCPSDLVGEVHADGEVIGSLGWSLRKEFGKSVADRLVWGAASLLVSKSTFGDFARGIQQTAAELETAGDLTSADVTKINDLIAARGLDDCDNELTLEEGQSIATNMLGLDIVAGFLGGSCQEAKQFVSLSSLFHFQAAPQADAKGIRFKVDLFPERTNGLDWGIYVRRDQHVGFKSSGFLPEVSTYDYAVEHLDTRSGELVIDENSDPPFDPTVTYHMVIGHQNCPLSSPDVSFESLSETGSGGAGGAGGAATGGTAGSEATGGSAGALSTGGTGGVGTGGTDGAAEPADETSGCGCSVPGTSSTPAGSLLGLALGLAALVRRRRKS